MSALEVHKEAVTHLKCLHGSSAFLWLLLLLRTPNFNLTLHFDPLGCHWRQCITGGLDFQCDGHRVENRESRLVFVVKVTGEEFQTIDRRVEGLVGVRKRVEFQHYCALEGKGRERGRKEGERERGRKEGGREGGRRERGRKEGEREGGRREGEREEGGRERGRKEGEREGGRRERGRKEGEREGGRRERGRKEGEREGGRREREREEGEREGGRRERGRKEGERFE